jgi:peptide/nickel transport system ATP-binding protein
MHLREKNGYHPIFFTHVIGLVYYVFNTVYIMEQGVFVESGSAGEVFLHPRKPYTQRLISDVPKIFEEWDFSTV